jgi:hypothetical protein
MGNLARRRAIVDETGGSAFAEHVTRADAYDEQSAARRPRAFADDGKPPVMRVAS